MRGHRGRHPQSSPVRDSDGLMGWSLPPLPHDTMVVLGRELQAASHRGDLDRSQEIRERMVRHNLGLVGSIAKRFATTGVEQQDLIGYGVLGLLRAIEGWDPAKGNRFSTYAVPAIANGIMRMITSECHTVRVPAHAARLFGTIRDFASEHGRAPTAEELARAGKASLRIASDVLATPRTFEALTTPQDEPREDIAARSELSRQSDRAQSVARALEQLDPTIASLVRYVYDFSLEPQAKITADELATLRGVTRKTVIEGAREGATLLRDRLRSA